MEIKDSSPKQYRVVDFLREILVIAAILAGMWVTESLLGKPAYRIVVDLVMTVLGLGAVGLMLRISYLQDLLPYDNGMHLLRFWIMFLLGGGIALLCGILPVGGWPYVVIYITLTLFGNQSLGVLGATVLLSLSVTVGEGSISAFMLYFISGMVGTILFRKLDHDVKVMIPFLLSQMVLFVCETAYILVQHPGGIGAELFVIPFVNVVVTSVMLLGILKLFFAGVLLKDHYIYSDLLNPDGELLSAFKSRDSEAYYQCMHTAYFCDRIARYLGLPSDPVRTAGFYQKIGTILKENTEVEPIDEKREADPDKQAAFSKTERGDKWTIVESYLLQNKFPEKSRAILKEYLVEEDRIGSKEATILIFADAVVASVSYLFSKNPDIHPDYDKLVDGIFHKGLGSGLLKYSSITLEELTQIRKIFKEEKLYYDFIRRK
jgi:hypothetical protein